MNTSKIKSCCYLDRHGDGTLTRGVTPDEATRMDENATLDASLGGQLGIAQAAPVSRQLLAGIEAVGGHGHGLDAPTATQVRVESVQHRGTIALQEAESSFIGK